MFDTTLLILLGLAALGFISHNTTVAISILVLIIVRVTPLNAFFPWVEKQGLTVGIIILTIGVMAPIASGTLPPSTLIHSFMNWKSLLAIAVGVFVSWLGGRGVSLMGSQPHLVAGLLVGTVLGVALFRALPGGPDSARSSQTPPPTGSGSASAPDPQPSSSPFDEFSGGLIPAAAGAPAAGGAAHQTEPAPAGPWRGRPATLRRAPPE